MSTWTIAYQYHRLELRSGGHIEGNEDYTDSNPELCFQLLSRLPDEGWAAGKHITVACHHGLRPMVRYAMSHYIYVRAAGGVVATPSGQQLLILRNGRWDLPKGGVEPGETLQQTAMREVEEETGMHHLHVERMLVKTYHIYNLYGGWHLKQTTWYAMSLPAQLPITVQAEEGITAGEFVNTTTLKERLHHSYATLQIVADKI